MKNPLIFLGLFTLSSLAFSQEFDPKGNTGSIYNGATSEVYLDRIARKKGDLLMVMIDETSVANFAANTTTSKNVANQTSSSVLNAINFIFGPFSNASDHSSSGKGSTDQASRMVAKMSVIVKEVDSAGNLHIEGMRSLVTNKDTQTFVLSGIVRQSDIMQNNTVESSKIANAQIQMAGKGQIADRQRKGLMTQILEWIF